MFEPLAKGGPAGSGDEYLQEGEIVDDDRRVHCGQAEQAVGGTEPGTEHGSSPRGNEHRQRPGGQGQLPQEELPGPTSQQGAHDRIGLLDPRGDQPERGQAVGHRESQNEQGQEVRRVPERPGGDANELKGHGTSLFSSDDECVNHDKPRI